MINNYQKTKIQLDKIRKEGIRPSILLHSCCGPCSTYPIELLNDYFDITIFYNNSNIYPEVEYNHRLNTQKQYIEIFNKEHNSNIEIIETIYDHDDYMMLLRKRAKDAENGPRCKLCYATRLIEAFEFAKDHNYDYVGTVMSMSRQKDEQVINRIGNILSNKYGIKFLIANFKKKGGQERRDYIVDKYNLYDQTYCGCEYSLNNKKE